MYFADVDISLRFIDSDWGFSFEQRLGLSSRGLERREIIEGEISTSAKYRVLLQKCGFSRLPQSGNDHDGQGLERIANEPR